MASATTRSKCWLQRPCRASKLHLRPTTHPSRAACLPAYVCYRDVSGHILPHGGSLVDLMVKESGFQRALIDSCNHQQEASERNACDVELLAVGGFSPLEGFMNKDVYDHVVQHTRCGQGVLGAALCAGVWGVGQVCWRGRYSARGLVTVLRQLRGMLGGQEEANRQQHVLNEWLPQV